MTISNHDPKMARIMTVLLASATVLAVARALRRSRTGRENRPEHVIPEPMDPNDSRGRVPATTASEAGTGVAGVLDRATAAGYTAVFEAEPGAELRCGTCGVVSGATTFERAWQNRLEGASDPDDMAQVSGLVCPACGALGTFVSLFGPGAETDAADVMVALPRPLGDLPIVTR